MQGTFCRSVVSTRQLAGLLHPAGELSFVELSTFCTSRARWGLVPRGSGKRT